VAHPVKVLAKANAPSSSPMRLATINCPVFN